MGTKLHELLAVEGSLATTAASVLKGTVGNLEKRTIYTGQTKVNEIFSEDDQHLVQAPEHSEVQSTVQEQLDFASKEISRYWDVSLQKGEANQRAKADIIIDGKAIAKDIPATVLLDLEKKLTHLLPIYNAIPTLDAATAWEIDPGQSKPGVYRTKYNTERQQSETLKDWKEVSAATPQHKAQLAEVVKTNIIGKYTTTNFCSALTSHDKAAKLGRLTALIRAVQTARQRANAVEVTTDLTFGKSFFDFING